MIIDNSLIALELFHSMKQRNKSKTGLMAMKLDMSKAYDRVEWGFLRKLLLTMGFDGRWVNLVMKCVSTVSYSFIINGRICGSVAPARGLRQGDPLSPFLFILVADAFSQMIQQKVDARLLHGAKASRNGPEISHLLFVDDSLLFTRATRQECLTIVDILNQYEQASGQKINYDKSEVSFSGGVCRERQEELINLLQMKKVEKHQKYPGIPTICGRSKKMLFRGLLDRMWKKLRGWKEKLLSRAGKEVLIKAVIQAIPTYLMGVYKFPVAIIHEFKSAMARFWWGGSGDERKMHWLSWDKLCKPKCLGGLGFKDLEVFNDALLGRQVWRLVQHKNSLLSRVFSAKYYPHGNVLEARLGHSNSFSWRSIWSAKSLVKEVLMCRVGNGQNIDIWQDPWVGDDKGRFIESDRCENLKVVGDLIDYARMEWRCDVIEQNFNERDQHCIFSIPLSSRCGSDGFMWAYSKDGRYTVKTAYMLGKGLEISPKARHFMWRLCTHSLPVRAALKARHIIEEAPCPWCRSSDETAFHALMGCVRVRQIWVDCGCAAMLGDGEDTDFCELLVSWGELDAKLVQRGCFLAWNLWSERNKFVFENTRTPLEVIAQRVARHAEEHASYADRIYVGSRKHATPSPNKWCAPPGGLVKAKQHGLKEVIIESDAQVLVSRLSSAALFHSDLDAILGDIVSLCSWFNVIHFSHVRRDGNAVAHHLTKVVPFGYEQRWEFHCPSVVSPYVLMDVLSLD
ncbi:uncharacterized protein LOC104908596 [Beta vulgaris subsp. vulgaris]|uniref:uncharacterized protein LOC104908596 n=1 Tax=Beta vulgaris subsp. vulgaris TaxID=3555 RepID=UPI002036B4B4|nr:uncharacterized protein LOC104908596 [Beta vulgaris subsp. vulgaris]